MKPATDIHIGQRVYRGQSDVQGTITRRDGDRYSIEWDDGAKGFVLASALDAAHAAWLNGMAAPHRQTLRERAHEARSLLDAIRRGDDVNAIAANVRGGAADLSDADRAKILARLSGGGKKSAPTVSSTGSQKPASAQTTADNAAFASNVSKHVRTLLKGKMSG